MSSPNLPAGFKIDRPTLGGAPAPPAVAQPGGNLPKGYTLDPSPSITRPTAPASTGASWSDLPKDLAGAAVGAIGGTVRGFGEGARALAPMVNPLSIAQGIATLTGTELPEQATMLKRAISAPVNAVADVVGAGGDAISRWGKSIQDSTSQSYRDQVQATTPTGEINDPSSWGFEGDPTLLGGVGQVVRGIGSVAPVIGSAIASRGATLPAALGISTATAAAQGGGAAAQSEEERILQMPQEALDQLPAYRELIAAGQAPDAARAALATSTGQAAFSATAPVSALSGLIIGGPLTRPIQNRLATAIGGGALRRAAVEGTGEAIAEGTQEVLEQAATTAGANSATGESRALMEGSLANFALGAATGGVIGAGTGAISRPHAGPISRAAEATVPVQPAEQQTGMMNGAPVEPAAPTITRPRFEDAVPGSIADAANAIPQNAPAAPAAQEPTAARAAASDIGIPISEPIQSDAIAQPDQSTPAKASQPAAMPPPPWTNTETGELGKPTPEQLTEHMIDTLRGQIASGGTNRIASPYVAKQWGVSQKEVQQARRAALKIMAGEAGVTAADSRAADREGDQAQLEDIIRGPREELENGNAITSQSTQEPTLDNAPAADREEPQRSRASVLSEGGSARSLDSAPGIAASRPTAEQNIAPPRSDATAPPVSPEQRAEQFARLKGESAPATTSAVPSIRDAQIKRLQDRQASGSLDEAGRVELEKLQVAQSTASAPQPAETPRVATQAIPGNEGGQANPAMAQEPAAPDTVASVPPPASEAVRSVEAGERGGSAIAAAAEPSQPADSVGPARVEAAAAEAAISPLNDRAEPTQAQKEAGNYAKGHVRLHGMEISIENPAGTKRNPKWGKLKHHYGYIRRTEGADGDHVDVFLGPRSEDAEAPVFVVDQVNKDGSFDESKVMLGFDDEASARSGYLANYTKGWKGLGAIKQMSLDEFKAWVKEGDTTKPTALEASQDADSAAPQYDMSRTAAPRTDDAHTLAVARAVNEVTKTWGTNQPRVRVIRSASEFPADVRRHPDHTRAYGLYYPQTKTVYIVAPKFQTERAALVTLAHEAIGHHGVNAIVDEHVKGGWQSVVDAVKNLRDNDLGSDKTKAVMRDLQRRYGGMYDRMVQAGQQDAADLMWTQEFLAVSAERGIRNGLIDRVLAAIRAYVRQIMPNLRLSDAELRGLLQQSENFIKSGQSVAARDAETRAAIGAMAFSLEKEPAPTFYSALAKSIDTAKGAPKTANAKAWKEWLDGRQRNGEFKADERAWLGLDAWLDEQGGDVTRQQIADFVSANEVEVQETVLVDGAYRQFVRDMQRKYGDKWQDAMTQAEIDRKDELFVSGDDRATKFAQYQLPGGKDYRELLMTLTGGTDPFVSPAPLSALPNGYDVTFDRTQPEGRQYSVIPPGQVHGKPYGGVRAATAEQASEDVLALINSERENIARDQYRTSQKAGEYRSGHFPGTPNILAHIRFNERTDADGNRVMFLEEVQSDWHQEGRKKGYKASDAQTEALKPAAVAALRANDMLGFETVGEALTAVRDADDWQQRWDVDTAEQAAAVNAWRGSRKAVPDAPFKTTWPMLAMKRAIRWAAENGFDKVAWTTGEQQAARYDLSKQVSEMVYWKDGDAWGVSAVDPDGKTVIDAETVADDKLEASFGKDVAERMRAGEGETDSEHGFPMDSGEKALRGSNLTVGGEGMKAFYDKMLPNEIGKYTKKWGAKPGKIDLVRTGELNMVDGDIEPVVDNVHVIDINPAMRAGVMEGQPLFSLPAASVDAMEDALKKPDEGAYQQAKSWVAGKWRDFQPAALGALQLRHLLEIGERVLPGMKQYADIVQQMGADRNQSLEATGALAQKWRDWSAEKGLAGFVGRIKPEAKVLSTLIHDSTIDGVDPSREYQPLHFLDSREQPVPFSRKGVAERIKVLRNQMLGRPGDDKRAKMEEIKHLQGMEARERKRKAAYPGLVARWQQLSPEAQAIYTEVRDHYEQHSKAVEEALKDRAKALDMPDMYKRKLIELQRLQFETERLDGVYFPLQRFGDYWISATSPSGEQAHVMFESFKEYDRAAKQLKGGGYVINATGRKDTNPKASEAPSGTFVAEIVQQLQKAGVSDKVQDEIYQTYLKALPEMSMRKHSIHRKAIAGYSGDALRAFAKNGFHGAHQLSKLRFGHLLQASVDAQQVALDNARKGGMEPVEAAAADGLLAELKKRHDWVMSPKDSQLSNMASSIGFIYYLGVTPAAAIINLTQGAQVTFPVLAAKFGAAKSGRMLAAATRDAMKTWGNIEKTLTTDEDKAAYQVLRKRGDIEKTQAHSLAGIAEGDSLRTNPTYAKVMNGVSYLFSRMEIINREAAGIASFRLARSEGQSFDEAVKYASDIINGTHFDYSNANRARFMQGNVAKVLLQFRSYSVGMSWMLGRNAYLAFKGEDAETRRLARRTLTGILGVTALMSGTMGLPMIGVASMVMSSLHAAFGDDDEPYDFSVEFRSWLAEHMGPEAAKWIADGAVNRLGADVAGRVKLSDLWFRDADRELEGRDLFYHALEQVAGPMGGIAKNLFVGKQQVEEGNVWRGIETMLPKFAKDAMKATRFASEGANTMRGDPLLEDVTSGEQFIQALGFTPTRLAEQYRENRALKNYEQHILDRRQGLLNAFALATRQADDEMRRAVLEKMQGFNRSYPEIRLDAGTIRRSMQTRARHSAQAEAGVLLNRRIADRVRDQVGVQ